MIDAGEQIDDHFFEYLIAEMEWVYSDEISATIARRLDDDFDGELYEQIWEQVSEQLKQQIINQIMEAKFAATPTQ